ncbi:MAG: adenylyltransferase/cytidyltransferase family protein [Clostridia bacterium]|nr:adenylyltransferase/cytidyltransferase family protein [Clostridia bacterium]
MKYYKTGYTTGAFDLFHIGHLNILQRAKERCEHLIVGVSTDELIREYKHHTPIIPFEERIEIVRALRCVDEVVPQETMDKLAAWQKLRFDAMFHGDDWKNSDLYNRYIEQFRQVGVDVVFLPHTAGISSAQLSDILRKLK